MKEKNLDLKMRFCNLCGKNKPAKNFVPIDLSQTRTIMVKGEGCNLCAIVVHNANRIFNEEVTKMVLAKKVPASQDPKRIVIPQLILPMGLKTG